MSTVSGPARRRAGMRSAAAGVAAAALVLAGCDDKITDTADHTPPTVEISAPLNASNVSGVGVWIDVDAADSESGVERVEMRVNGVDVFVDDSAPYSLFLPTIINNLGTASSPEMAQLMTVPPYVVACLFCVSAGWYADKIGQRGIFMIGFMVMA